MNKADYVKLRELVDGGATVESVCSLTGWNSDVALRYINNRRYRKAYFKRFPGRSADRKREQAYGLSVKDYAKMLEEQGGVCAICGNSETVCYRGTPRRLSVDHCHDTGCVRKLLCTRCNTVLGYVNDDTWLLGKMVSYLSQHKR